MIWILPILAVVLVGIAEVLHYVRCRRLGRLAFGPAGRPRNWTVMVPVLRIVCMGTLVFSLWVLMGLSGVPHDERNKQVEKEKIKHLIIGLDVSPSMDIKDAGPTGKKTRSEQASSILKSIMERVDMTDVRVTIIPFYTKAMPMIIDTFDPEVVNNVLDGMHLDYAFEHGKTNMHEVVKEAAKIAKPWAADSAVLVVVSDGDTLPGSGMGELPVSIAETMVVGVGSTHKGTFIDGHASKQDAYSLKRLALQTRGLYHDGNTQHVPTSELEELSKALPVKNSGWKDLRFISLVLSVVSASILAFLSPLLAAFGTPWRPPAATIKQHNSIPAQGAYT